MIAAELNGKIPSTLQNSEDLLTSSVIGLFQYLSSHSYFQSVLESSVNLNGHQLTFDSPVKECCFVFWPKLENSEPDVLLRLKTESDSEILICIEAKYWSHKSSHEDESIDLQDRTNSQRDQLAREIEDIHKVNCLRYLNINRSKLNSIVLIYLTNHTYLPREEILESILHVNGVHFEKGQLYWLTWREIHNSISKIKNFLTLQDLKLLNDLKKLLEKKGLQSFNGFQHHVEKVSGINITYNTALNSYSWNCKNDVEKLHWYYGGKQNG
ncbi:hypothetical protein [Metabacillus fastidiosus]|uniref:NERD domain-containing protein n=1 Tax=Metabacillus fastidiosus TaxID=1458 RepID=A0ABU6P0C8_9BACI|nr:hypothetical protein [Metabacillus fastidiosus]MED4402092.1 hypothetical protein [Metabacillus fastidiosus]